MSACIFFASDAPLPEVFPLPEYDYLAINVDDGTIDDGRRGRQLRAAHLPRQFSLYRQNLCRRLDWAYYTEGRARS